MEWLVNNDGLLLLARVCLVVLFFPFSGLDKIVNLGKCPEAGGLQLSPRRTGAARPGNDRRVRHPGLHRFGWYDGLAAFVLAGYCVITAILYHNFWAYPRFWSPGSAGYPHLWDFLKNFGLVGGLLLIVLGSDLVCGGRGCRKGNLGFERSFTSRATDRANASERSDQLWPTRLGPTPRPCRRPNGLRKIRLRSCPIGMSGPTTTASPIRPAASCPHSGCRAWVAERRRSGTIIWSRPARPY